MKQYRWAVLFLVAIVGCKARKSQGNAPAGEPTAAAEPGSDDAAAGAAVADGGEIGPMVAALRSPTPIFSRPEIPPREPNRAADEKKEVVRLGSLRKGQRVAATLTGQKGGRCSEGWYKVAAGGWLCGRHVTTDFDSKELKDAPHAPYLDRALPY